MYRYSHVGTHNLVTSLYETEEPSVCLLEARKHRGYTVEATMGASFLSTLPSLVSVPSLTISTTPTIRCPSHAVSSLEMLLQFHLGWECYRKWNRLFFSLLPFG